ncbi:MAG: hypothetical protein ACREP7_07210, partial [Lysobacter sp.]
MRSDDGSVTAVHNRIWLQAASCFALTCLEGLSSSFTHGLHRYDAPYGEAVPMSSPSPVTGPSVPRSNAPAALSAFLRGVERRGAVLA